MTFNHKETIQQLAANEGFNACHFAQATHADPDDKLGNWLQSGYHADMDWMVTTKDIRQDPRLKLPEAQTVIVLALNYYHEEPDCPPDAGKIAKYARGKDYHKVIKKKLIRMARQIDTLTEDAQSYVAVDSGPIMERTWAEISGLGWVGKNSLILRRDLGSWFFLGVILTTMKINPDTPVPMQCGTCRACIEACPTDAIVADTVVDARKCISYQTIENRHSIPDSIAEKSDNWIFGCDICQDVCPWNRFATPTTEAAISTRPTNLHPNLTELAQQSEEEFNQHFAGTPVRRTKHSGMQRNVQIALNNRTQLDEA